MARVLITGGSRYIGSHALRALGGIGYIVSVYDMGRRNIKYVQELHGYTNKEVILNYNQLS